MVLTSDESIKPPTEVNPSQIEVEKRGEPQKYSELKGETCVPLEGLARKRPRASRIREGLGVSFQPKTGAGVVGKGGQNA